MNIGQIYAYLSISIAIITGFIFTLSLYYLYLKIRYEEET